MHREAFDFVSRVVYGKLYASVIEIGSRDINGSVRPLFVVEHYHGIDLYPGRGVDEVADAMTWRPAAPVDCVVCCEVLEHAPDAPGILLTVSRCLQPNGTFIMTCATDPRAPHSARDGGIVRSGEYYGNISPTGFVAMTAAVGLEVELIEVHGDRGDLYAVARKR